MMKRDVKQYMLINEQTKQIAELLGYAKDTKTILNDISRKNDLLLSETRKNMIETEVLNYQVRAASESIEIIMKNKTVPVSHTKKQYSRVYGKSSEPGVYYFVRGQKANANRTASKIRENGYDDLIYDSKDPNPFNSFNNLKELLDNGAKNLLKMKK